MINILYIGNKLSHENSNVTTIETLGKGLSDEGYQVIYASSKVNKFLRLLDMLISVIKNRKNINYVLIDTYSTQNFYYALLVSVLCKFYNLKYIPILHGGDLPNRLQKTPKFSNYLFNDAYVNVSPSVYLKNIFNDQGYNNIEFIPNSINLKNYPLQKRMVDKPKLFWLRSYKKLYNPLMAIKVVNSLKNTGLDCELCMVGPDGDGSYTLAQDLARELNIDVNFNLKLKKEDWINLSQGYNIFINTTNFDNLPVSVIEAMALGLPIVSTNVGGIPFLIEDEKNGLLVRENDVQHMADQIVRLLNDPQLVIELSLNARKTVEQFDWEIVKKQWKTLLK